MKPPSAATRARSAQVSADRGVHQRTEAQAWQRARAGPKRTQDKGPCGCILREAHEPLPP